MDKEHVARRLRLRLVKAALVLIGFAVCSLVAVSFTLWSTSALSIPSNTRRVFPKLVSIRDSIIQAVFGQHPTSYSRLTVDTTIPTETLSKYTKFFVARFNITTAEEANTLKEVVHSLLLDVWAVTPNYVDIRVRKDNFDGLLEFLPASLTASYSVLIPDLVSAAASTYPRPTNLDIIPELSPASRSRLVTSLYDTDNLFFQDYQPLSVVIQWMRLLEAMFPDISEIIQIGNTYEGREINALRVGSRLNDPRPDKPRKSIIVTGGLHAREWISTTSVNYAAWSFITGYNKDTIITKMLQTFDIIFIPALNPDGVEYTWSTDRLWRKSRQHTKLRWCRGFDLDRVFDFQWDAKSDPCSESYSGSKPLEAVEAAQFAQWVERETAENNVRFVGLLDLHSYSQQVLFPYSYTCQIEPPNLENLEELGTGLVKAIRLTSGESYSLGAACEGVVADVTESNVTSVPRVTVESKGGSFLDWVFHELGVRFSFQIKLRDTGNYGFLLPKEFIIPTGEEVLSAMKYFGDFLDRKSVV